MNLHSSNNPSEELREKALTRNRLLNSFAGLLFILIGLGELVFEIANKTAPGPLQAVSMVLLFAALVLFLYDAKMRHTYKLAPTDEFEIQQDNRARARGFEYLSGGIFIVLILFPMAWMPGLIYMLFGGTWVIVAGLGRDGKAAEK